MKEIFEQYGGAIITVIAVVALAALISMVIGTDATSPVYKAFNSLLQNLGGLAAPNTGVIIPFPGFRMVMAA